MKNHALCYQAAAQRHGGRGIGARSSGMRTRDNTRRIICLARRLAHATLHHRDVFSVLD